MGVPVVLSNSMKTKSPESSSFLGLFPHRHRHRHSSSSDCLKSSSGRKSSSWCRASWQDVAGVVILSAIPFATVKAIANSSIGATLQNRMLETKAASIKRSSQFTAAAKQARKHSFWYGEKRPRWLGPIPYDYPPYLTGELPGDYGFDVVGLSKDPVAFQKYFNFEILHARWAMLAALGALVPELLDLSGVIHFIEPVWWRVGYAKLKLSTIQFHEANIFSNKLS